MVVSTTKTRLRVGVLGAAKVLRNTWIAIHGAGHVITVVGCRDIARGQSFVDELCTSMGLAKKPLVVDYETVVTSTNVDVVYIPLPVTSRSKWVLECAKHGKHVVGEKPTAVSSLELREWLEHLGARRLLFMDGTTLSHGCRVHDVRHAIGEIGKLRCMEAYFSFLASQEFLQENIRLDPMQEPMGVMGDLGWYCVRYFLHMVDFALPDAVMGRVAKTSGPKGGISAFSGELVFTVDGEPVVANFFCTFHAAHEQVVRIKGDAGIITVHGAINPTDEGATTFTVERNSFEWSGETPSFRRDVDSRLCDEECTHQSSQLWRDVGDAVVRMDPKEPPVVIAENSEPWAHMAWVTQCVCDKLMESAKKSAEWAASGTSVRNRTESKTTPTATVTTTTTTTTTRRNETSEGLKPDASSSPGGPVPTKGTYIGVGAEL